MVFGKSKQVKKPKGEVEEGVQDPETPEEPEELEEEENFMVVEKLPVQPVRQVKDEETGKITNLITMEEAMTDMTNNFKKLTKGL